MLAVGQYNVRVVKDQGVAGGRQFQQAFDARHALGGLHR